MTARQKRALTGAGLLILTMGLLTGGLVSTAFLAAGTTLVLFGLFTLLGNVMSFRKQLGSAAVISDFIERDSSPSFIVSEDGEITGLNAAARANFPGELGKTLASAWRGTFANPGGIILRLKGKAELVGSAREDIVTRGGQVRVAVHQMSPGSYLWRLETVADGVASGRSNDGPGLPMLMVGRAGTILYMSDSARDLIGRRVRSLNQLFNALPVKHGGVNEILTDNGTERVLVSETDAGAGRTALYLLAPPKSESDLRNSLFDELPVALLQISSAGDVEEFNRTAVHLMGGDLKPGVNLAELTDGLGRPMSDWISETIAGRAVQHSEFLKLRRSDREIFVQITLNRIVKDGQTLILAVLSDATELKTLEAQFVQSQKMQAIGQLAGGVAHDFNNLLTAISGHCDLLLLRHDPADNDYNDLVQINQNANRAAALVGQLLAFSRKQTLRPEILDVRDTLADLTHLLNRLVGERVTLSLDHDPVLKSIHADKRQLEQVLMNLVVNARDAMPDGGQIRIETETLELSEPLERDNVTVPDGSYVAVRVIDEGIGIPRDKLQKVFEPFYTTKRTGEGTGLGLSTAYGIVKQTGGFIFVDSEVGSGTCFTLMFPARESVATSQLEVREIGKILHEPKRGDGVILLVEDEAPVRAFASRALRLRGYTVLEADSAEAALKTLEDATLEIDLFVTDVVMPGKDGPSWVKEALQERPDVRVVFVSGYAEDKLKDEQANIPNSVFLPKPFSLNDLAETVHRQMH